MTPKCPKCGSDLEGKHGFCTRCGKFTGFIPRDRGKPENHVPEAPRTGIAATQRMTDSKIAGQVQHTDIPRRMSFDYAHSTFDTTGKVLDGIIALTEHMRKQDIDVGQVLTEAANLIQRHFSIADVGIGLRSPSDGLYRYEAYAGLREEAVKFRRTIAYKREEFFGAGPYKGYAISKYTRIYLSEDAPWVNGEKDAYNRPALVSMKRRFLTDFVEGDYLDIHLFGLEDDLLGWIEISGTRMGKLPDVNTVKWIELIGRTISTILTTQQHRRGGARPQHSQG